jgi:hypothetical protein
MRADQDELDSDEEDKETRHIEESYEDERTERKLKAKMPELESKDGPPSLDEDKELLSLTDDLADKLHVAPSLWRKPDTVRRGRGLDQFHVATPKGTTHDGGAFAQMRADQDKADSEEEEEL